MLQTISWKGEVLQNTKKKEFLKSAAHLFHGPEHPEEVEAGQLLELVHRPVPGVEQRDKELGVARHVRQTNGDSGMVALQVRIGSWLQFWRFFFFWDGEKLTR